MKSYIALDVGGTSVSAAVVSSGGHFILPVEHYSAHSHSNKETIINNFVFIIDDLYKKAKSSDITIEGIGIGFPGPFNYKDGISLMKGIGKYDSLYGVNIRKELLHSLSFDVDIRFCNDADLYCMGECVFGEGKNNNRCMCICIGTGIGSGFFADGNLIIDSPDVPQNGWIYKTPYKDGIADEYISATGIKKMMLKYSKTSKFENVKELADAAYSGLPEAIEIFNDFGNMLCDVVLDYAVKFKSECLILGGDVSRSCDLFDKPLKESLSKYNIKLIQSVNFSDNALLACVLLFKNTTGGN